MRSRFLSYSRARTAALALGVGAIGALATAPASFAAGVGAKPPTPGAACQLDGKISGRGSSFQTNALNLAFILGYQNDVCGPVGNATNMNSAYTGADPVGSTPNAGAPANAMIAYNDYTGVKTGSGAGQTGMSCRTDAFGGSDLPYNNTVLGNLNGAPGTQAGGVANCNSANGTAQAAPFGPNLSAGITADATANMMSFPVTGGAVALAVNLNGMCTSATPPTGLVFTSQEAYGIWQGTINTWNDPALIATDPILSTDGCSGNITRVVRFDNSGTTGITMTYLNGIQSANGLSLCDTEFGTTWATLAAPPTGGNTNWPLNCTDVNGHAAPAPVNSGSNGSPSLITKLEATQGGIGYAELGLWGTLPAGDSFVSLESQTATVAAGFTTQTGLPSTDFVSAGAAGAASNCNIGARGLPGTGTPTQAVGLGGTNANWSSDSTNQVENITYAGSGYPACGLTWDFVYAGINPFPAPAGSTGSTLTTTGPMQGLNFDQLRTLYSFFTYVFSPAGQEGATVSGGVNYSLNHNTYDQLPAAWLDTLRTGFQQNF